MRLSTWRALYTKPRSEKKVVERLRQMGIQTYCPMIIQIRQWSDRKKKVLVPAISSYVFVKLEDQMRNQVFHVPGVIRYLYWLGKLAVIRDYEIEAMKEGLSRRVESVTVAHYKPGDHVQIPSGLFKDKNASVQKMDSKYLFLILEETGLQIILKLA